MQPTYNSRQPAASPSPNPWQLGPTASRIARWVFGLGFFSVHLGIFLIVGLALLMINLYRSPDDLWVGGPLLRWGIVVVIHGLGAIVTWAITTAVDAAEATRRESTRYEPSRTPPAPVPVMPSAPMVPRIPEAAPAPRSRFRPGLSTPVESGAVPREGRRGWQAPAVEPAPHRPSPPGWVVMRPGEPAPSPAAPIPATPPAWAAPASATAPSPAVQSKPAVTDDDLPAREDNRWTWVEAAAEAWLANRPEKPAGASDPTGNKPS